MSAKKTELVFDQKPETCIEETKTHHILFTEDTEKSFVRDSKKGHNILIEGENYQALKVLQFTHPGKIDVITIDPPYNTGNKDFVYNDSFVDEEDTFRHAKWLSMMKVRLELARELLSERGVIFMHIDDNEQHRLRCLCDQVFGEQNFVANLIWKKRNGGGNDSKHFAIEHEYILCYAKSIENATINKIAQDISSDPRYKLEDEFVNMRGKYLLEQLQDGNIRYSQSLDYPISAPDGAQIYPHPENLPNNGKWLWRWNKEKSDWGVKNGFIEFKQMKGKWKVYTKQYQLVNNEGEPVTRAAPMRGILDFVNNSHSRKELQLILGSDLFDYAKPVELIKRLLFVASQKDSIILDFFAGSGTTGQAVAELNKEDGGTRQFILVTNNDKSDKLPDGICQQVTYPRLEKTIGDQNLKFLKIELLQMDDGIQCAIEQLELNDRLSPIMQMAHNTFNLIDQGKAWRIFTNHDESYHLGIFSNSGKTLRPLDQEGLKQFKLQMQRYPKHQLIVNRPRRGYACDYYTLIRKN